MCYHSVSTQAASSCVTRYVKSTAACSHCPDPWTPLSHALATSLSVVTEPSINEYGHKPNIQLPRFHFHLTPSTFRLLLHHLRFSVGNQWIGVLIAMADVSPVRSRSMCMKISSNTSSTDPCGSSSILIEPWVAHAMLD